MSEDSLVAKHEAGNLGDPREAGRKGALKREQNRQALLDSSRQALEALRPAAINAISGIIEGARRPNVLPAAQAVLDRTGLGPTSKTEVALGPSEHLVELIQRLDREAAESTEVSPEREVTDVLSHPSQANGGLVEQATRPAQTQPEGANRDEESS